MTIFLDTSHKEFRQSGGGKAEEPGDISGLVVFLESQLHKIQRAAMK
jgi:hypothetical protein